MLHKVFSCRQVPVMMGLVVTLVGAAHSVDAASITVNFSDASLLNSGPFQGFDPTLGTLESVNIDATATLTVTFVSQSDTAETMTAEVFIDLSFFSDALALSDSNSLTQFVVPGGTFSVTATDSGSVLLTTGLSSFLSAGLISFSGHGSTGSGIAVGDVAFASFSRALAGTVTYNYTPAAVPEPTTVTLLGFGFGSLGVRRWRRRRIGINRLHKPDVCNRNGRHDE